MSVYSESGLTVLSQVESADGPRHYEVTLYKGSGSTFRHVSARKDFGSPENSPFDVTKTYTVTIEEDA